MNAYLLRQYKQQHNSKHSNMMAVSMANISKMIAVEENITKRYYKKKHTYILY